MGYNVEQICIPRLLSQKQKKRHVSTNNIVHLLKIAFRKCIWILRSVFVNLYEKKYKITFRRVEAFENFNQVMIPHSQKIFSSETLSECVDDYDIFITGSDQVWNFWGEMKPYLLDFVPSHKTKLSYAASIARSTLSDVQKEVFRTSLRDYKAISVREYSAKQMLLGIAEVEPQVVLDPTLLLRKEEWDCVCAERTLEKEYAFCYFLGDNKRARKIVRRFAKKHGLFLVVLPHAAGINFSDIRYGDARLYDASPEQFLSLIKHAKYVFTDSFHAVVFSNIYQKQYFVFNRSAKAEMSSRITDITALFHQEERFCAGKERESLTYVESLSNIDYTKENKDFENLKKESIEFLENNLKD